MRPHGVARAQRLKPCHHSHEEVARVYLDGDRRTHANGGRSGGLESADGLLSTRPNRQSARFSHKFPTSEAATPDGASSSTGSCSASSGLRLRPLRSGDGDSATARTACRPPSAGDDVGSTRRVARRPPHLRRWRRNGVTIDQADEFAVAAGFHAGEV